MFAERAEYAAVSWQRLEDGLATFAFVEIQAGIAGHCFSSAVAAGRTGDRAGELDHCSFTNAAA
jgi:hypothetical protein